MRIVFFGVEDLGVQCLTGLLDAGWNVVGVVTLPSEAPQPPKPKLLERLFKRPAAPTVAAIAHQRKLALMQPLKLRDPAFQAELARLRPDLLVVACFDKILPPAVLNLASQGGINVHPSLLPHLRGPAPVARALLAGDPETGLTVHQMDATIDTGAILVQRRHPIHPDDTAGTLAKRLAKAAPAALLQALEGLEHGTLAPRPQQGEPDQAPFITREEAHLDWRAPLPAITRTIRACNPYPGAFTVAGNSLVAVLAFSLAPGDPDAAPGQVLAVDGNGVLVQASQGAVRCHKLRQGGAILAPPQYARLFSVGDMLASGDWSALQPH